MKEFSLEEIEKEIAEYFRAHEMDFINEVSPGCFRLPGGLYTGRGGVDMINEQITNALKEELSKYVKPKEK